MTGRMSAVRAIVFDFDGVIANSEPLHFRALQELLASLGVALTEPDYYAKYVGYDDVGVFEIVGHEQGWALNGPKIEALVRSKAEIFDSLIESVDVLFPHAAACIEALGSSYPLGIASGALKPEIVKILRRYGLEGRFKFVVAAGDTPQSKPAPDPYRKAAALHGLPPSSCVAVEDSRWGIESAQAAGLRCVGITTTYPAAALGAADAIIDSLEQFTPAFVARLAAG